LEVARSAFANEAFHRSDSSLLGAVTPAALSLASALA
jgi:hypothetical protein